MSQQAFMYGLLIFLVVSYGLFYRRHHKSRFHLRRSHDVKKPTLSNEEQLLVKKALKNAEHRAELKKQKELAENVIPFRKINIHFNYNGHSWDAYEVLGVPAGSSFDDVQLAYEEIIKKSDEESRVFYLHAIEAIQKSDRRKKL